MGMREIRERYVERIAGKLGVALLSEAAGLDAGFGWPGGTVLVAAGYGWGSAGSGASRRGRCADPYADGGGGVDRASGLARPAAGGALGALRRCAAARCG